MASQVLITPSMFEGPNMHALCMVLNKHTPENILIVSMEMLTKMETLEREIIFRYVKHDRLGSLLEQLRTNEEGVLRDHGHVMRQTIKRGSNEFPWETILAKFDLLS